MRVLILGAGAIGGYYGARLIEAGHDVAFLVRPARAALLAETGLRLRSDAGVFAQPITAVTEIAPGARHDLVLLSCKAYDLASAIAAMAPAVGADTRVLPLLNGLRQLDMLDAAFGPARVLGGLCHISVTLDADGAIRQFGTLDRLTFGSRDPASPVPAVTSAGLRKLGANVIERNDILAAMWDKFVFIAALAGLTCLLRGSVGEIVASPEGVELARRLYAECAETAQRCGHAPSAVAMAEAERILTMPGSPLKASMLRDVERGARTECEHILGDLRERAWAHALDTPLLAAALAHVRVHELSQAAAIGH
ncbi:2-dehydropantoate 2-reductase [Dokdonella soli]|uniref:2-dehydropantoate 2-reductase n=1 Tax=Dokdonella soli TaxID=529810 RepID=A0ABN1IR84_9GAMM